jgi:hypothetical protein
MMLSGVKQSTRINSCQSANYSTTNTTWTSLGMKSKLRSRLSQGVVRRFVGNANRLSHGAGRRVVGNGTSARIYIRI